MAIDPVIYAGSASFDVGDTPFGFYDTDPQFQSDAENMANYCARRLGYPIMDVELNELNFFAAFESAVTEYGNLVNTYAARDNILALMGISTGSSNINQTYVKPTLKGIFQLAKMYGSQVGAGGNLTWYSGSISLQENKQVYDLISDASIETGSFSTDRFTIRKVFHYADPSKTKFYDPQAGSGLDTGQFLDQFGWGSYSPPLSFVLMPTHYDVMRMQAIEFNDLIRRSGYSFQLTNNRLRIFPLPKQSGTLWFNYTLDDEEADFDLFNNAGKVTDHSNIPYGRLIYGSVNEIGRQWIRKYTLAICKEMLGYIRGKHNTLPSVLNTDTTLNYSDLLSAAEQEKQDLTDKLIEILDQMSRQSQLERNQQEADLLSQQLAKVPTKIFVG